MYDGVSENTIAFLIIVFARTNRARTKRYFENDCDCERTSCPGGAMLCETPRYKRKRFSTKMRMKRFCTHFVETIAKRFFFFTYVNEKRETNDDFRVPHTEYIVEGTRLDGCTIESLSHKKTENRGFFFFLI